MYHVIHHTSHNISHVTQYLKLLSFMYLEQDLQFETLSEAVNATFFGIQQITSVGFIIFPFYLITKAF